MARGRPKKQKEPEMGEDIQVEEGVSREEPKVNTTQDFVDTPKAEGDWKKVSHEEMVALEMAGDLLGYDQKTGEVLVKGGKK